MHQNYALMGACDVIVAVQGNLVIMKKLLLG